jgi:hypothetical protein
MKKLPKAVIPLSASIALILANHAVFAQVDVPIVTAKENGNKVVTGITMIEGTVSTLPLTGAWIESKTENSSRKLNVYKDGTVLMDAQQNQYLGSIKHSLSTGNSSLRVGVCSEYSEFSGSLNHSRSGLSSYGLGVGHGNYSGSVTHSPKTGNSSLNVGVGSQYGNFSGSVNRSPGSGDHSYGIGWKTTW